MFINIGVFVSGFIAGVNTFLTGQKQIRVCYCVSGGFFCPPFVLSRLQGGSTEPYTLGRCWTVSIIRQCDYYFFKLNMLVEIAEQLYLFMLFSTILTLAESYRVV